MRGKGGDQEIRNIVFDIVVSWSPKFRRRQQRIVIAVL